ncbi:aspartate dehydrogenase [bacterium]|nr:aspartate dehydrogenase [bacterium]
MPKLKTSRLTIGIIGCGAIGSQVAKTLTRQKVPGLRIATLTDIDLQRALDIAAQLSPRPKVVSLSPAAKQCDVLLEAAGSLAVPSIAQAASREKKQLVLLSVGALIQYPEILEQCFRRQCPLHFPSGAIAGLDALKAASAVGKVRSVILTTRKPPRGLAGAPFFQQKKMDPGKLKTATTIFSGTARRAIRLFPANVNVAAAVSLVGLGPDKTRVNIIADPRTTKNSHTLEVAGDFGKFTTTTENIPSRENLKTSFLAAASAVALLTALAKGSRFGT